MAHGFEKDDTMFSVRQIPWHGLGTVVQDAPTAADAIRLAGLDWTVSRQPLMCCDLPIPGRYGLVKDTDHSCLGICGDWYRIVQNTEAFNFLENLVGDELRFETAGSLFGGKKVFITTKFQEQWRVADDDIDLYLLISNGHTGMDGLKVAVTPVRVVCNNTLQASLGRARRIWSMVHSDNIDMKLEEARETLRLTDIYMQNFVEFGNRAALRKLEYGELDRIIDTVFPENPQAKTNRSATMRSNRIDRFMACYGAPDLEPYKGTAWGVLNAMSDYETHVYSSNPELVTSRLADGNMKKFQTVCSLLNIAQ